MSSINRYWIILFQIILISGMLLLPACSQMIAPNLQNEATASPTEGTAIEMTATSPTPAAPLQNLIEAIKTDLANRLAIPVEQIALVEATEVEWSDSSLDCPQAGMEYLQVITPGYQIVLEAGSQRYEYHTNRDTYFVYCQNQGPPVMPKP